ncbi:PTS system, lactose/cellobiose family IIC component [Enterococcus faecium EnGen0263]|uniref:PTS sugar transporter subunit IIC n=1 Tax=Enterococcus TaxID=1350 RepID=UPI0003306583|nr:PTS transporter subunit EIIC [Enterococcus faecium]EOH57261.1 PTS system, lactose/cellobiose family IIC component [Enterococcus faecium EnGen0263]MCS8592010.1 PTS sugar transporter subunit IIC [Enterococcus faecium]
MNKFLEIMERRLVPVATTIGQQRHLVAIRDAFVASMPLMILGSIGTLINTLPIQAYQDFMMRVFGEKWLAFGTGLNNGTFNILSLLTVIALGYNLGKAYGKDSLMTSIVAVSSFFIFGGATGLASKGLFVALFCGIVSSEIFIKLLDNKKLVVKMPDGVPPAVGKAFDALFPSMITLAIFGIVPLISAFVGIEDIVLAFYEIIQEPFMGLSNNLGAAIIIPFSIQILWFFGLHGGNVLAPFMETLNAPAIEANISALASGQAAPYIINKPFMTAFVHLGGSGATIGLIIAILLVARHVKSLRAVSGLSAPAATFNINEPMIFGFPIVLNPILFVPFVVGPVILCVIAYLTTLAGLVPAATFVVPWNIPPVIGGVLATQSWAGGVLAAFNLVLSIIIYLPFVKLITMQEIAKEKAAKKLS